MASAKDKLDEAVRRATAFGEMKTRPLICSE